MRQWAVRMQYFEVFRGIRPLKSRYNDAVFCLEWKQIQFDHRECIRMDEMHFQFVSFNPRYTFIDARQNHLYTFF